MALGLGPGDELITNANTFFATAEAIWIAGCTAVLVDCDETTRCIDPEAIAAAITKRTKAIVPVHLYGQCAPMREIRKIADEHGLFVIEDNAQAIDARGDDFKIGELSDAVCTSFIIQKNLGTFGDGGAVWTNHADINDTVRKLRNHGSSKRDHHSYGFNSRLDDLHAGVLSAKLQAHRRVERPAHRQSPSSTTQACKDLRLHRRCPTRRPGYRHVYHLYEIETKNPADRDELLELPERATASTPRPTTRSRSTSRKASPGARTRASRGSLAERREERRLLHLAADVPRADRRTRSTTRSRPCAAGRSSRTEERARAKYTVAVAGLGKRGMHHADAVAKQPALQARRAVRHRPGAARGRQAEVRRRRTATPMPRRCSGTLKPDVFVFCTLPQIRLPLIRAGVEAGVKLIAFEKPVATSMSEGLEMQEAARRRPASRPWSATSTATASTTRR